MEKITHLVLLLSIVFSMSGCGGEKKPTMKKKPLTFNPESMREVTIGDKLAIKLPEEFKVQAMGKDAPGGYMAIGPSPNGNDTERSVLMFFLSEPVKEEDRDSFYFKGSDAMENMWVKAKLQKQSSKTIYKDKKPVGEDAFCNAHNNVDMSWWGIRTAHEKDFSVFIIACAFSEGEYRLLAEAAENVTAAKM